MLVETWYYIKEEQGRYRIHECYLHKEKGCYARLAIEGSGVGYQSIADFPYRLYRHRQDALKRCHKEMRQDTRLHVHRKTEESSGLAEHKLIMNFDEVNIVW